MQRVNNALIRRLLPILEDQCGIDFRLYMVLRHVENGTINPGAIAKAMFLPKTVMARHIDHLVKRALLKRTLDAHDSRRINLSLTRKGRSLVAHAHQTISHIVEEQLDELKSDERDIFIAAFARLARK